MIRAAIIVIPLLISAYSVSLALSPWTVVFGLLAVALSTGGAAFRRFPLVAGGAAALLANYLSSLPSLERAPNVWTALGVGIGSFLLVELGYDWIHAVRRPVSRRIYAPRLRYLAVVAGVAVPATFFAVTIGYNFALRSEKAVPFWLGVLGVVAAVASAAVLVLFWIRSRRQEETADDPKD